MIVGRVNLDKESSKFIKRFYSWLADFENTKNLLSDYVLERRHVVLKCKKCGQLLCPATALYGPQNCGWQKEKSGGWICHQCRFGFAGFDEPQEVVVEERNRITKAKMKHYQLTHPWIHFKEV